MVIVTVSVVHGCCWFLYLAHHCVGTQIVACCMYVVSFRHSNHLCRAVFISSVTLLDLTALHILLACQDMQLAFVQKATELGRGCEQPCLAECQN